MARNLDEKLTVHGIVVNWINEANVAKALDQLDLDYAYQYYLGGSGIRGSQIIDFLVYTVPKSSPLLVHGNYWHGGQYAQETELKDHSSIRKMRGTWNMAVVIWEHECETEEQAYNAVRAKLAV